MAATLQTYLATTRFILHDANSITFTDAQLTNCVNLARDRVQSDGICGEAVVLIRLASGQEFYTFNTILASVISAGFAARGIQAILSVNFVQTLSPPYIKYPLAPRAWNVLNERFRINPVNSMSAVYSVQAPGGPLWLAPPPSGDQFQAEIRCSWLANPMVSYTDMETGIPSPLAETLVPLMAASWAWSNNDDEDTADKMESKYMRVRDTFAASMPPYSYDPYSSIY